VQHFFYSNVKFKQIHKGESIEYFTSLFTRASSILPLHTLMAVEISEEAETSVITISRQFWGLYLCQGSARLYHHSITKIAVV